MTTAHQLVDPPLGPCPPWCDKPSGHDWEDEWTHGPMREHLHTVDQIGQYNAIRIREYEHFSASGARVRHRGVVLDLDQSEDWDPTNAARIATAITTAIALYHSPGAQPAAKAVPSQGETHG
ncbi:hypothetical protein [Mycolicibacterium llatzerense]|uniref:hypothetical protein n=1 Tax=Mycolicibacterium llatzerense TaxID=280871 RepID=UPI0008DC8C0B|nr:hypothetical protein [Mycolicibacterium llatzerense]